jgi:Arc/MetJ-type ribon-helix-helix transcriptional regulator
MFLYSNWMGRKERAGPPDEKVTINLGPVDVGRIDLLVEEGFYGSRTDLIRTAVRRLLEEHKASLDDAIVRQSFNVGVIVFNRPVFEELRGKKERLHLRVIGVLRLTGGITPDLADEVIESIRVLGHLSAPAAVRKRLEPKMVRREADA